MKSRKIRMASLMLAGVITLGLFAGCSKDASQSSTSGGSKDSIVIATIGASNKTRLNNPEVDALIDQACATIDEAEREEVLRQCNTLINELCPQVPLFQDVHLRAYNANLEGVEINAAGFLYFNDVKWKESQNCLHFAAIAASHKPS